MRSPPAVNPRELIDPGADWHLSNWAQWFQRHEHGIGFMNHSGNLSGYGSKSVDDMEDDMDRNFARAAGAAIESLTQVQQCSIHNVYIADVWKHRGDPVATFVEAAAAFWVLAQKRGLE